MSAFHASNTSQTKTTKQNKTRHPVCVVLTNPSKVAVCLRAPPWYLHGLLNQRCPWFIDGIAFQHFRNGDRVHTVLSKGTGEPLRIMLAAFPGTSFGMDCLVQRERYSRGTPFLLDRFACSSEEGCSIGAVIGNKSLVGLPSVESSCLATHHHLRRLKEHPHHVADVYDYVQSRLHLASTSAQPFPNPRVIFERVPVPS